MFAEPNNKKQMPS